MVEDGDIVGGWTIADDDYVAVGEEGDLDVDRLAAVVGDMFGDLFFPEDDGAVDDDEFEAIMLLHHMEEMRGALLDDCDHECDHEGNSSELEEIEEEIVDLFEAEIEDAPRDVPAEWLGRDADSTAMMKAAQIGCCHMLEHFMEEVFNYDVSSADLQDLLAEACSAGGRYPLGAGYKRTVEYLIRRGAKPGRRTRSGSRRAGFDKPIHLAALHGNRGAFEALIDAGADVAARGRGGRTVLHFAAVGVVSPELVSALLQMEGVNLHAVDAAGLTAMEYAFGSRLQRPGSDELLDVDDEEMSEHPELSRPANDVRAMRASFKMALHEEMISLATSVLPKAHGVATCVPRVDAAERGTELLLAHRREMAERLEAAKVGKAGKTYIDVD